MSLPSTNISMANVCREIGTYTNYLSALCKSNNINKWSKWKPIKSSDTTMTAYELKNRNYGYSLNSATTQFFTNSIDTVLDSARNIEWYYRKPEGGASSPYRLGDFRNYNHQAEAFYYDSGLPISGSGTTLISQCNINIDADILPEDFTNITNPSEWRYVMIYRQIGQSAELGDEELFVYDDEFGEYYQDAGISIMLPAYTTIHSKWESCLALAKTTEEEGVYSQYTYLPHSYRWTDYNPNLVPFRLYINYDHNPVMTMNRNDNGFCNSMTFWMDISDIDNTLNNFIIRFVVENTEGGSYIQKYVAYSAATISTDQTLTCSVNGCNFYAEDGDSPYYERENDHYNVWAEISYGNTTKYFSFGTGTIWNSATECKFNSCQFYSEFGREQE